MNLKNATEPIKSEKYEVLSPNQLEADFKLLSLQ